MRPADSPPGAGEPAGEAGAAPPPTVRVLVVDDETSVGDAIRSVLTLYGWSVTTAAGGSAALAAVGESDAPFDLMIVDLVLGGAMGGLALADLLHRAHPNACFLFISGQIESGLPRDSLPGVPTDFLAKPMSVARLLEKAERLLGADRSG